jgi:hypothetical protein
MATDEWVKAERDLTDDERGIAHANLHEAGVLNDIAAGVLRQIIGQGLESLTFKQAIVYDKEIRPSLVEKCSGTCSNFVPSGVEYCSTCEIEYGD